MHASKCIIQTSILFQYKTEEKTSFDKPTTQMKRQVHCIAQVFMQQRPGWGSNIRDVRNSSFISVRIPILKKKLWFGSDIVVIYYLCKTWVHK